MILLLDNYDSFTYNIAQILGQLERPFKVIRNDKIAVEDIAKKGFTSVVISPGPGIPDQAGITLELIERYKQNLPILVSV